MGSSATDINNNPLAIIHFGLKNKGSIAPYGHNLHLDFSALPKCLC